MASPMRSEDRPIAVFVSAKRKVCEKIADAWGWGNMGVRMRGMKEGMVDGGTQGRRRRRRRERSLLSNWHQDWNSADYITQKTPGRVPRESWRLFSRVQLPRFCSHSTPVALSYVHQALPVAQQCPLLIGRAGR